MTAASDENSNSKGTSIQLDPETLARARARRPAPVSTPTAEDLQRAAVSVQKNKIVVTENAVATPWESLYGKLLGECSWDNRPVYAKATGKDAPKKCPLENHPYVHQGCWDENSHGTDRGCPQMGCEYGPDVPEG